MKSDSEIRAELHAFIVENFLMGDTTVVLPDNSSFLDAGVIDSTGVLEVVMFLEQNFGLKVADRELVPENFDSMDNLTQFVGHKLRAAR